RRSGHVDRVEEAGGALPVGTPKDDIPSPRTSVPVHRDVPIVANSVRGAGAPRIKDAPALLSSRLSRARSAGRRIYLASCGSSTSAQQPLELGAAELRCCVAPVEQTSGQLPFAALKLLD